MESRCDRDRSSSSSDPGSAIEGFGQKIPLHDKLADLGMQLRHLGVAVRLNLKALVVEDLRQLLDRLPLPLRDQVRMKLVPRRQLRDRPLPLDRLKRDLRLELGREPSARPAPAFRRRAAEEGTGVASETGPPVKPGMTVWMGTPPPLTLRAKLPRSRSGVAKVRSPLLHKGRGGGAGYQRRMNSALRHFVAEQRKKERA